MLRDLQEDNARIQDENARIQEESARTKEQHEQDMGALTLTLARLQKQGHNVPGRSYGTEKYNTDIDRGEDHEIFQVLRGQHDSGFDRRV